MLKRAEYKLIIASILPAQLNANVPFTPRGIRAGCPSTQVATVTLPEVNEQGLRLGKSVHGMELVLTWCLPT
jgi:hypothetical protein